MWYWTWTHPKPGGPRLVSDDDFSPLPGPVLVTGAGGFIGSHLTELCVERGLEVRAFVHYRSDGSWGWLDSSPVSGEVEVIAGDVRDFDVVYRAMEGCGTVLHLAALIGIPYSYVSPQAYIRTNVEGTYNILEGARLHGVSRVGVTSTSETYGTAQYVPIDEGHPSVAQSPYAATKVAADQLALSYHKSFELPVWVVRPFNTYGPRQSARAIIPTVITQILSGRTELELGNLSPTRDLTYVRDTARGYLSVVGSDALVGSATNVGMNEEISMGDLVDRIARLMGADVQIVQKAERIRPEASEVDRLRCDNSRLTEHTGWRPRATLDDGLRHTIDFLSEELERYKAEVYNV